MVQLRSLYGVAILSVAIPFMFACEKHENSERSESIEVYASLDATEPSEAGFVDPRGGEGVLYVRSNVDFTVSWQDDTASPWLRILDYSEIDSATGYHIIRFETDPRSTSFGYYTRRTGMMIISAADGALNFNKILPVHQGLTARVSNDFSNFRYGSADPRISDEDVPIKDWTTTQIGYGFTSTVMEGEEYAHCYGKNGYLRLGDDKGHGADLISPITTTLRYDSLLMVSFKAVAYTDYQNNKFDDNKLHVEITGGGVIADFFEQGTTQMDLEVGYYDMSTVDFPTDMWNGTDYVIFIASTEQNPITNNTQIHLTAGSLVETMSTSNRIFIDNFYIRRLEENEMKIYYTINGGSGRDRILGPVIFPDSYTDTVE